MTGYGTEPVPPAELCDQLRAAASRLLAGTPLRSDGKLTIKSLAEEAGIKRWILVNKYPLQLKGKYEAEFRQADRKPGPLQAADERAARLARDLKEARAEIGRLEALNRSYAQVIDQLSVDLGHTADPRAELSLAPAKVASLDSKRHTTGSGN